MSSGDCLHLCIVGDQWKFISEAHLGFMYPITPLAIISTPSRNLEEKEDLSFKYGDWQLPFNAPKKYCSSDSGYNSQAAFGTA